MSSGQETVPDTLVALNAGVRRNERACAHAGEAKHEYTLTLDPPTVLALVVEHFGKQIMPDN